jgi:hypothetical protein
MMPPSVADLVLVVTPSVIRLICCPFLCHDIVLGDPELLLSVSHFIVTLPPSVMGEIGFLTIFSSVADPEKQHSEILTL